VGQQIGNYQLVKLLGQGGFARVYLGKHRYLNSYAALKVLNTIVQPGDEHKVLTEAQALVALRHANIVHLLDFAIEDGTPVLIMDYAQKGSLRQSAPPGTQMPVTTVVAFVKQIAAGLQYAHNHHVIHRDVKPENILLDADNRLLLSDFGLSLLTPTSQQLSTQDPAGTARYMAPEQLYGKPCPASDQYALGVMVYEWLCGKPPFQGNMWEVSHQHMYADPPALCPLRPELPGTLEDVVLRSLAKMPEDRFVSVEAFAQTLAQASQTYTIPVDEIDAPVTASTPGTTGSSRITPAYYAAALVPRSNPTTHASGKIQAKGQSAATSTAKQQNRIRLQQRVRSFWITGVLEQSLYGTALMTPGLQEQADAIANPWLLVIQESEHVSTPLPAGTRITEVYDEVGGELLILGEPGAGKTTLLLELARDLLKRCEQEQTHPIPVVFNLSSWRRKRQPLANWLIEELETKYLVPRGVGSDWIDGDEILPLLDGLDEVDASSRSACMQAINEYHREHSIVPLVVCCRVNEYRSQVQQLALSRAVTIQPLSNEQINAHLARIGKKVASLHIAFQRDAVLQELATTPLMLTILILAYQDVSLEEIKGGVSAEVRREQIFALYTERVLKRRSGRSPYQPQQTIHWLGYLAQQMKQQSQTVFYIEHMQPGWLTKRWQRRWYYGLTTGPIAGAFVALEIVGTVMPFLLTVLMTMLTIGVFFGWLSEAGTEKKNPKPITRAWMRIRQRLMTALENRVTIGVATGLVVGTGSTIYNYLSDVANWSSASRIVGALSGGLPGGICMGVYVGLSIGLARRIEALEGASWSWARIRRDNVRWLLIGTSLIVGLIFALPFLLYNQNVQSASFLSYGLSTAFQLIVIVLLVSGVTRGLSKRTLDTRHMVAPNQGIWRSVRSGLVMAIITGGVIGTFSAAIDLLSYFWLLLHMGSHIEPLKLDYAAVNIMSHVLGFSPHTWQDFWTLHALFWGLVNGAIPALAVGLYCGGAAYVQHFVLRFLLWCDRRIPFNYAHFLDYAAERILLRKVGGGYIFVHRLLLEYFAGVENR
jgi:serine/threonine protein kinase